MPATAASRYARALADVVFSAGSGVDPARAIQELRDFEASVKGSPELRHVLESPAIAPQRKRAVIDRLSASLNASRPVRNFLKVIIDHRRSGILDEIVEALQLIMDERLEVQRVLVTSAAELTPSQREELARGLESATGRKVTLSATVDPELIGGVVAKIGSTVYDGSVRGKLRAMAKRFTEPRP